jgi:hypothetical protein
VKRQNKSKSKLSMKDMTGIVNEKTTLPKFVSKIILRKGGEK